MSSSRRTILLKEKIVTSYKAWINTRRESESAKVVGDRLAALEAEMQVVRRDAEKAKQEVGKMQAEVRRIWSEMEEVEGRLQTTVVAEDSEVRKSIRGLLTSLELKCAKL